MDEAGWQTDSPIIKSILEWPFDPSNATVVAGWGFWFGLLGLAGLAITFWQLVRTKSLAQSAKNEAERLRLSLLSYDAAQEASRASYALLAARKHFANGSWVDGAECYEDFRRSLISLSENIPTLDISIRDKISNASSYILRLCKKIDNDYASGTSTIEYAKVRDVIRKHDDISRTVTAHIQMAALR